MEYRRFVAYVYEYVDGKKHRNCGFIRVEIKNGAGILHFHLVSPGKKTCPVTIYGYVIREKLKKIPIAKTAMKDGVLDTKVSVNAISSRTMEDETTNDSPGIEGKTANSSPGIEGKTTNDSLAIEGKMANHRLAEEEKLYRITDFQGIVIIAEENLYFLTQWDETPVDINWFKIENGKEENREKVQEKEREREYEKKQKKVQEKEYEKNQVLQEMSESEPEDLNIENPKAWDQKDQGQEDQGQKDKYQEDADRKRWEARWSRMQEEHEALEAFEDGSWAECIKINLQDIANLQKQDWTIGNNSFLLHGFYAYKYLMMGKIVESGQYVLGVPGTFDHQESFAASLFGFQNFKALKENPNPLGQFGYWFRIIM